VREVQLDFDKVCPTTCGDSPSSFLTEKAQRRECLDLKPLLQVMWRPEASFDVEFIFPKSALHRKLAGQHYNGTGSGEDFQPGMLSKLLRSLAEDDLNIKEQTRLIAHIGVSKCSAHGIVFYRHIKHAVPCDDLAVSRSNGGKYHVCSQYKKIVTYINAGKLHFARNTPTLQTLPQNL
jgi:hypothetical protein